MIERFKYCLSKFILITWFIVTNKFNLEEANKDAAQTLRKIEWENKISGAEEDD